MKDPASLAKLVGASVLCLSLLPVSPAAEMEIPCVVHGEQKVILVQVRVNGKDQTFLLDTGAARTVVSPTVLGGLTEFELKLSRFRSNGPGISGEATWERIDSLRLGEHVWHDRPVVVMNLKEVSRVYGRTIDGLLGQDILSEFDQVVLDFEQEKVRLVR